VNNLFLSSAFHYKWIRLFLELLKSNQLVIFILLRKSVMNCEVYVATGFFVM